MSGGIASVPDRTEVVLLVVSLSIAGFLGATGPWQTAPGVPNDPCWVDQGTSYVPAEGAIERAEDLKRAVVYVERYQSGDGPDCVRRSLGTGDSAEIAGVALSVDGDGTVLVEGDELGENEIWQSWRTSRTITDPWYDHHRRVLVQSTGTVEGVELGDDQRSVDHDVRLVTGSVMTSRTINPITTAIFLGATFLVVGIPLEWSVRAADMDEWNE